MSTRRDPELEEPGPDVVSPEKKVSVRTLSSGGDVPLSGTAMLSPTPLHTSPADLWKGLADVRPTNNQVPRDAAWPGRSAAAPSLDACYAHTDLAWRLRQIPDTAGSRGVFLNMLDAQAGRLGSATQREYREFFRIHKFSPFRLYPTRDFLTRLVVLAQMHWGAEHIFDGVRALQSSAFDAYSSTIVGKAILALVQPRLDTMLQFIAFNWRAHAPANYSEVELLDATRGEYRMRFKSEYVYIEHAMEGALEGLARVCSTPVTIETNLDSPFDGVVTLRARSMVS